jgi:MraZ protein
MFLGQYQHSIDSKGRLTIPARFREVLAAEGAYVTQGFDHNLMVLTIPLFEKLSKRVNSLSLTDPLARQLRRKIFSNAELVEVDRAGRVLIPQFLREAVGLDGEAIVVGSGNYFEIWSPEGWSGETNQMIEAESDAQRFMDLDLSTALE